MDRAPSDGVKVRGYVSCIAGCPYEGPIPEEKVLDVTCRLLDMGCYEVSLGDTIGVATPSKILRILEVLLARLPPELLALHCHDTYGMSIANIFAGLTMGISTFDSSVSGLGGCPYAKGASGNAATEDLLYLLQGLGIFVEGGPVNLEQVVEAGRWISDILGRENGSKVGKAFKCNAVMSVVSSAVPSARKRAEAEAFKKRLRERLQEAVQVRDELISIIKDETDQVFQKVENWLALEDPRKVLKHFQSTSAMLTSERDRLDVMRVRWTAEEGGSDESDDEENIKEERTNEFVRSLTTRQISEDRKSSGNSSRIGGGLGYSVAGTDVLGAGPFDLHAAVSIPQLFQSPQWENFRQGRSATGGSRDSSMKEWATKEVEDWAEHERQYYEAQMREEERKRIQDQKDQEEQQRFQHQVDEMEKKERAEKRRKIEQEQTEASAKMWQEEERRMALEEEERKKKELEEERRKKEVEEEQERIRKAVEEKQKLMEEEQKRRNAQEEEKKRKAEEEERRRKEMEEEEKRRKAVEEEEKRKKAVEEEEKRRQAVEEEEKRRKAVEEEEKRKKAVEEEEKRRKAVEEEEKRKALEEEEKQRKALEEQENRKAQEEEEKRRKAVEDEEKRRKAVEKDEKRRAAQEEEEKQRKAQEEKEKRNKAQKEEEERRRVQEKEEERRQAEEKETLEEFGEDQDTAAKWEEYNEELERVVEYTAESGAAGDGDTVTTVPDPPKWDVKMVRVVELTTIATSFYVRLVENEPVVEKLDQDMISHYLGSPIPPCESIKLGDIGVAPFREGYFRAKVESLDAENQVLHVYFIDYGNSDEVRYDQFFPLPSAYASIPPLVEKVFLYHVHEVSSRDFLKALIPLVSNKELRARRVLDIPDDPEKGIPVDLYHSSVGCIHSILIQKGVAVERSQHPPTKVPSHVQLPTIPPAALAAPFAYGVGPPPGLPIPQHVQMPQHVQVVSPLMEMPPPVVPLPMHRTIGPPPGLPHPHPPPPPRPSDASLNPNASSYVPSQPFLADGSVDRPVGSNAKPVTVSSTGSPMSLSQVSSRYSSSISSASQPVSVSETSPAKEAPPTATIASSSSSSKRKSYTSLDLRRKKAAGERDLSLMTRETVDLLDQYKLFRSPKKAEECREALERNDTPKPSPKPSQYPVPQLAGPDPEEKIFYYFSDLEAQPGVYDDLARCEVHVLTAGTAGAENSLAEITVRPHSWDAAYAALCDALKGLLATNPMLVKNETIVNRESLVLGRINGKLLRGVIDNMEALSDDVDTDGHVVLNEVALLEVFFFDEGFSRLVEPDEILPFDSRFRSFPAMSFNVCLYGLSPPAVAWPLLCKEKFLDKCNTFQSIGFRLKDGPTTDNPIPVIFFGMNPGETPVNLNVWMVKEHFAFVQKDVDPCLYRPWDELGPEDPPVAKQRIESQLQGSDPMREDYESHFNRYDVGPDDAMALMTGVSESRKPFDPSEHVCRYFERNGFCREGDTCAFQHCSQEELKAKLTMKHLHFTRSVNIPEATLPGRGDVLYFTVLAVKSPSLFTVTFPLGPSDLEYNQLFDQVKVLKNFQDLPQKHLARVLNKLYDSSRFIDLTDNLDFLDYVVVRYQDHWARARFLNITSSGGLLVKCIDLGMVTTVSPTDYRPFKEELLRYPPLAYEATLADVTPLGSDGSGQHRGWSKEAVYFFTDFVKKHQEFIGTVIEIEPEGSIALQAAYLDDRGELQKLSDVLLERGLADLADVPDVRPRTSPSAS
ncbi:unnamed protein product [Cyprideis torosa]|uniref:tRNA-dihydrouridine(47) synthase [NAD(P)(+)]-like n=1 Tax=Cyprideis torosa TaxID=163714 RepID=A0A7R8WLC6_9CRUS|nr:unnamed protein product [Cyprideis torosa]CAG0897846.1 unnamed protein product [Cyprideis torosa]